MPVGAAYVFSNSAGTTSWTQLIKLLASDASSYDEFGGSVAIYENIIIVGAPYHLNKGITLIILSISVSCLTFLEGSVYVFSQIENSNTWSQTTMLVASNGRVDDTYGCSVSIYRNAVSIGALGVEINNSVDQDFGIK